MLPGAAGGAKQRILSLSIESKQALYRAYMPFIQNGGLFIPTNNTYTLGDDIFLLLRLMEEPDRLPIAGNVVWITPKGAEGNRAAGIGIQFSEGDRGNIRKKIENYLAGMLESDRPTHTL